LSTASGTWTTPAAGVITGLGRGEWIIKDANGRITGAVWYGEDFVKFLAKNYPVVTAKIKVRGTYACSEIRVQSYNGTNWTETYGSYSGSGNWEEITITHTLRPDDYALDVVPIANGEASSSGDYMECKEVALYIGELPLPYQENPLDRALQAVHYQDSAGTNYEYRGLRCECGRGYVTFDGNVPHASKIVTFQKPFKKLLSVAAITEMITAGAEYTCGFKEAASGIEIRLKHDQDIVPGAGANVYFAWIAIGVD